MNHRLLEALIGMNDPQQSADPLDELVSQLLECGGVFSQILAGMFEHRASGHSGAATAPIPEVAHTLIRSAVADLSRRHSGAELAIAAAIIEEVTEKTCSEILIVSPEIN